MRSIEERQYQTDVINECIHRFTDDKIKSVMLEAPVGSGKTIMAMQIIKKFEEWLGRQIKVNWIAPRLCLLDQVMHVNHDMFKCNIRPVSLFEKFPPPADMIVLDEAHHEATQSCVMLYEKTGHTWTLGLSATPLRTDRMKLSFQHTVCSCGIRRLINEGYLSPFHSYLLPHYTVESVSEAFLERPEYWGKTLAFFRTIQECDLFQQALESRMIRCEVVTSESDKDRQLDLFIDNKIQVVANVSMLTEGFDLPDIKSVFVRDASRLPTIQMSGRGLRKASGKAYCNIIQSIDSSYRFEKVAPPLNMFRKIDGKWLALKDRTESIEAALAQSAELLAELAGKHALNQNKARNIKRSAMNVTAIKKKPDSFRTLDHASLTEDLCLTAVKAKPSLFEYVPESLKTFEICMSVLSRKPTCFPLIPDKVKSYEMCMMAVQADGSFLKYVPEVFKTYELCLAAFQKYPRRCDPLIRFVPVNILTEQICMLAVENNGKELEYIPNEFKTSEICLTALASTPGALEYMPDEFKTFELCRMAVRKDVSVLEYVPERLKSPELCKEALKSSNARVLKFIPDSLKNYETCINAIRQDGRLLRYVPDSLKDYEMCSIAVRKDAFSISYVPLNLRDRDICCLALRGKWSCMLEYVPQHLMDYEMCLAAVSRYSSLLRYVPEHLIDRHLCNIAAYNNIRDSFEYIPAKFKDYNSCMTAVRKYGYLLEYVPENFKDDDMCFTAVKACARALEYVPEVLKNYEICMLSVKNEGWTLKYVPEYHKDYDICLIAVQYEEARAINFVPEAIKKRIIDFLITSPDK